ncbi:MAG: hypothetical protein ACF8CQ_10715 [Rhodopirellula sp. JB044]|uniref:hypothetical protein n=1 Tax=Rhodopirellula sp. JB044 TaxID=3342844 RepID=UPI003709E0EB
MTVTSDASEEEERERERADFIATFGSKPRWLIRGLAFGMLAMASLNALSYFWRSDHWGSLLGEVRMRGESIGFPFEIWESGNTYGGLFADYPMIGANILVAFVVSLPIGILAAWMSPWLNDLMLAAFADVDVRDENEPSKPMQFSIQSLMIVTTVAAVLAMLATRFAVRRETLVCIYALGPLGLVLLAMLPRRLSWQQRVIILMPCAISLIVVAMVVGQKLGIDFDKVLMGIFLCWTPQSALAAIGLLFVIFVRLAKHQSADAVVEKAVR